jgi:hypothetical protein
MGRAKLGGRVELGLHGIDGNDHRCTSDACALDDRLADAPAAYDGDR